MPGSLDDSFLMHETASFTQKAADTGKRRYEDRRTKTQGVVPQKDLHGRTAATA
jgi:hypothetical protein